MTSNVSMMEEPAIGLTLISSAQIPSIKRTIHVDWDENQSELDYTIYSEDDNEAGSWKKNSPNGTSQIIDFWKKLNYIFQDAIPRGNPSIDTWQSICISLQGIGKSIFNSLVPCEVAKRIKKWETGFSVRVSTNEKWIPWELMYDGKDFLGDKFILTRYPRLGDRRNNQDKSRLTHPGVKQINKIVNVVGGSIGKNDTAKASGLFNKLSKFINIKILEAIPISVLVEALEEADILHFTCHGHLQPLHLLQISSDKSPNQNLHIDMVQELPLKSGCFVFANACTSSTPIEAFCEFTSFGWEFYRHGADIFIGTLGIIPTQHANNFAESLYQELLYEDVKLTIGQAVAKAKKVAAENNNIFWLLYCVYGNPDYMFETIE